jgi:hypothetical protein
MVAGKSVIYLFLDQSPIGVLIIHFAIWLFKIEKSIVAFINWVSVNMLYL